MEKYSKAVSEMYSQFKKKEAHPLEKLVGRLADCYGEKVEVVGYCANKSNTEMLILDASKCGGWSYIEPRDVIFKKCEGYVYASTNALID